MPASFGRYRAAIAAAAKPPEAAPGEGRDKGLLPERGMAVL